jgi:hypothetical protein
MCVGEVKHAGILNFQTSDQAKKKKSAALLGHLVPLVPETESIVEGILT